MSPPTHGTAADCAGGARWLVASVPADHVYVRHLAPLSGRGPIRLPDPRPDPGLQADTQTWWPPVMLDARWAEQADFDVFHVNFGFDARTPGQLRDLAEVLRARRKPLVFTVHDLRNPHHEGREEHDAQLDVLVPAADALVTLTPGAAAEIHRRWGRDAVVLPHPHVVEFPTMAALRRKRAARAAGPFRVGLHVKSIRASMDPLRVLPTLIDAVAELPGAVLQVNAHDELVDEDGSCHDPEVAAYLHARAAAGEIDLRVHHYFTDDELWEYLASIDVSVLPYRFGTHSGWLEACRDLGTTVIAPTCGYYTEQGPALSYVNNEDEYDADSLFEAVRVAYETRPDLSVTIEQRRRQRDHVARAHERLYRELLVQEARCESA